MGEFTHVTALLPNLRLNRFNCVTRRGDASGELPGKHRQIIQVVPCGKRVLPGNTELPGNFRQRRALIIGCMAEPSVNIVPNDTQKWDFGAIFLQEYLNRIRISIILRDEAKWRIGILVNGG